MSDDVATVELQFPDRTIPAEILELDVQSGLPRRVFLALLSMDSLSELTRQFERLDGFVYLARDGDGRELGRLPIFSE